MEAHAEQGAGQVQQTLKEIRSPLVANAEAAAAEEPGEGPLNDPPVLP
jgi:hypothetical protein